eukprot:CAMPEP_0185740358 /NCGR_PEP_ID=MMETSP1171-20130828/37596_1 /TAXON_ID=374046 /ORGANISM="Helicotheca tamensis, Strain CCMP826" /LENGTH=186 /DNA_ID=CAMNT_0028412179 /DNA_START=29 /DNA_END=589 /DNA_ORIENTATION=+
MAEAAVDDDWEGGGGEGEENAVDYQDHDQNANDPYGNYNQEGADDLLDLDQDEVVQQQHGADGNSGRPDNGLLMRFCPHDSSMLYPQEHKRTRTLQYACRICRYAEEALGTPLIYQNILKKEVGNVLHTVPGAVSDDPTLPRSQNASCKNCGHHEAVFFQSDTSDVRSDTLKLIFVCCNCNHKWVA